MKDSVIYRTSIVCWKEMRASMLCKWFLSIYLVLVGVWERSFIYSLLYKDIDQIVSKGMKTSQSASACRFGLKYLSFGQRLGARDSFVVQIINLLYDLFFRGTPKVLGFLGLGFAVTYMLLAREVGLKVFASLVIVVSLFCIAMSRDIIQEVKESWIIAVCLKFSKISLNLSKRVESKVLLVMAALVGVSIAVGFKVSTVLGVLVLMGLPITALVLKDRKCGLLLVVFFLPILPTMVILGLIGLVIVAVVLDFLFGDVKFEMCGLDVPVLLFAVAMIVSTVIAFDVKSSLMVVGTYFIFLALYVAIRVTDVRILHYLLTVAVSGFIVSLYGIYQFVSGNVSTDNAWIDTQMFSGMVRVYSTLANPNVLGIFLIVSITLTAGLYFIKLKQLQLVAGILLVPQVICMILTYSRGAWVGLVATAGIIILFNLRKLFFPALGLSCIALILMPARVIDRFLSIGNTLDSSTSYRVSIWENSIKVIKDFWITGIGFGTESFNIVYNYYAAHTVPTQHSHNLFLHIIMSLGIIGFIIFMFMIIQSCLALVRSAVGDKKVPATFLLAALVGILVQGLTDNIWYNYRIVGIFWVLIAIIHTLYYNKETLR